MLPRGHVEIGESAEAAAIRIVHTVCGLEVDIVSELLDRRCAPDGSHRRLDWFVVRPVGGAIDLGYRVAEVGFADAREAERVLEDASASRMANYAFARTFQARS